MSPLSYACIYGQLDLLEYIFESSTIINIDNNVVDANGWTTLHFASWIGDNEVVKGIDVNKKTNNDKTAKDFVRITYKHYLIPMYDIQMSNSKSMRYDTLSLHFV